MRTSIIIKIEKNKSIISNFSTIVEVETNTTYLELKTKIKTLINFDLEIESEEIYKGSKKVSNEEFVTNEKQLLYNLSVK